jgi:hypothetical protein
MFFANWDMSGSLGKVLNAAVTRRDGTMSMRIIVKSEMCRKINCPALYQDDKGVFYVQGYAVESAEQKAANLPAGESLVRIDASLVKLIKQSDISC